MASSPRSEPAAADDEAPEAGTSVGYAPLGHLDDTESEGPTQPRLTVVGWLRFVWRQLTSMRTAIVLLLLLAIAAVPGSLVPQTSSDPNGVISYHAEHPDAAKWLDAFGLFSTFTTPWFSAIYILLFVSLIGCIIPRVWHHYKAMVARPPRTPVRLGRLEGHTTRPAAGDAETAVQAATALLRRRGYRTERYGASVSAERGYLRETGNLLFHVSLLGVLISVGIGGSVGWTGQRVIAEGYAFTDVLSGYDSFNPGRFFTEKSLPPFSVKLDQFEASYHLTDEGAATPRDYDAHVTVTKQDGTSSQASIKVNSPLMVDGVQIYLLGNGYAPVLTVRDPEGNVVFSQPTLFRPMDGNLGSTGVVKIPDGLAEQVGIQGLFYPTAVQLSSGALASSNPDLDNPVLSLEVYTGDLGLDSGAATNAYTLDTSKLTELAGRDADVAALMLTIGSVVDLPDGLGTVELSAVPHFVALQMHHDPTQGWVFAFAVLAVVGLLTSLFIPRRRVWAKATTDAEGAVTLEWAGLARGEDPRLADAVAELADAVAELADALPPPADGARA